MKNLTSISILVVLLLSGSYVFAQEEEVADKPVRAPFESIWLLDGQTIMVPSKGTFEFDIQHRFGRINSDSDRSSGTNLRSLWGLYSTSNIRMGFSYVPVENLLIGFGNTKIDNLLDFNIKYAVVKQTRSWSVPVSLTYFGNAVFDAGEDHVANGTQRWSYFHEVMVATKINTALSVQLSGNYSHFNAIEQKFYKLDENQSDSLYRNDVLGISVKARYKFSGQMSAIAGFDMPVMGLYSNGGDYEVEPNISFGVEVSTSAHAFQVFAGRYYDLLPQYNMAFNGSENAANFLIGFNITRLWNF